MFGLAIPRFINDNAQFPVEGDFPDCRLRDPRIGCPFSFFIRLELFDSVEKWFWRV
jgi:hypothetical protein